MAERAAMRPGPQGQGATGSHKRGTFGGCDGRFQVTSFIQTSPPWMEMEETRESYCNQSSMFRRSMPFGASKKKKKRSVPVFSKCCVHFKDERCITRSGYY